jgi:hypothetical protein
MLEKQPKTFKYTEVLRLNKNHLFINNKVQMVVHLNASDF